ncbi:hypothetical protein GCM10014715_30450 [Streptomyces spiralis]|uniref:Uncharacterized protein n=1 Tax=Streptomyces spiralis TaxID=66376 RepID=A0A918ZWA0_9ACTN|nr:hypothetical protein GCM10014715_30450 [Streptomyces spiralis]
MTTEENRPKASLLSPFRPAPVSGAGRPEDTALPKSLTFDSNAGPGPPQYRRQTSGSPDAGPSRNDRVDRG